MRAFGFRLHHRWLLTFVCAAVWLAAFVATHIPAAELPPLHVTDKPLHFFGYAGLTTALWLAMWAWAHPPVRRILICATVLAIYGAVDEYTQHFFRRTTSFEDWLANCTGIATAILVAEVIALLARRRKI